MRDVVVVSAVRTALGSIGGTLKNVQPETLLATALEGALNTESLKINYIINPYDGSESYSAGGYKMFVDYNKTTGYAFQKINDRQVDKAVTPSGAEFDNRQIDFASENCTFAGWEITYVYTEENFNEITLCAVWENASEGGWAGFRNLLVKYIDTIVNYFIAYIRARLAAFVEWVNG